MKQAHDYVDVAIAGGGMVGASLALRLAQTLGADARILLVEAAPLPARGQELTTYTPSFDSRATALSRSSTLIYEEMQLWPAISRYAALIKRVHVSDRGRFGSTLMDAVEQGWDSLGHVVENAWLGQVLIQAVYAESRIELLTPATLSEVDPGNPTEFIVHSESGRRRVRTGLLVVADGAQSALRESLGVTAAETAYGQDAIVANIELSQAHSGIAYERFTDTGPLALLPLVDDAQGSHRMGLVWTLPPGRAAELMALADAEFLASLQARFGYRLGRLRAVGKRVAYPLTLVESEEQARSGIVVMGNAAHALHPVAGQGFNLALRDVEALCSVLSEARTRADSPGALHVLDKYLARQKGDQQRTILFSDRIGGLFASRDPLVGIARDLGLLAMDIIPAAKRQFVGQAAGTAGLNQARRR